MYLNEAENLIPDTDCVNIKLNSEEQRTTSVLYHVVFHFLEHVIVRHDELLGCVSIGDVGEDAQCLKQRKIQGQVSLDHLVLGSSEASAALQLLTTNPAKMKPLYSSRMKCCRKILAHTLTCSLTSMLCSASRIRVTACMICFP